MDILIIGAGIIGTIYSWALSGGGHRVVHLVRPGRAAIMRSGISLDLLDRRPRYPRRFLGVYRIEAVEDIPEPDRFGIVIFPGHHYQAGEVLAGIVPRFTRAGFVFLTQNWDGPAAYDAVLPRSRYVFGDAKAGGSWRDGLLVGALRSVDIGSVGPEGGELVDTVRTAFGAAGIPVAVQPHMLDYLKVQYALNGGLWPALVEAGSFKTLLADRRRVEKALIALRECLSLLEAGGIDLDEYPELSFYRSPSRVKAALGVFGLRLTFTLSTWAKRVSAHALANAEEIRAFYFDLLRAAEKLNRPMPVFSGYRPVIEGFRGAVVD